MDTSRVSTGELIAGGSGLALFLFLFIDWFGPLNAWEIFDVMDILLAIIGLSAFAVLVERLTGLSVPLPGGALTIALAGFAAAIMILTFLLEGEERKIGLWLGLFAAIGITYGGLMASRERPGPPPPAPAV